METKLSDALLTEILSLVQELNTNVENFGAKLTKLENDVGELRNSIDNIIKHGFPDGNLHVHRKWHERTRIGKLLFNR